MQGRWSRWGTGTPRSASPYSEGTQGVEISITQLRVAGGGLFYLFIFLSGMRLSRSGKPYNGLILTIHKLISLVAAVYLATAVFQISDVAEVGAIGWIAVAVTDVPYLATIVTGGLWSTEKPMPAVILTMYRIAPFLTVLCTALTIHFLLGRSWQDARGVGRPDNRLHTDR
jgi:hypothetical protein